MQKCCYLTAAVLLTVACSDSSGPKADRGPRIRLISGYDVTDTVTSRPTAALVVEVHDSSGAVAPQGTVVRFTAVTNGTTPEMLVQSLTSTSFSTFAAAETDAAGRAGVLVQLGTIAGTARIVVAAPTIAVQDTARYTVLPGNASRVMLSPSDTALYTGRNFTLRGGVVDRFNNVRKDPVTYTASAAGVSVSGAGVVSASAVGRYTVTATTGTSSSSTGISVVPQGTMAAVRSTASGLRIISVALDGSGLKDLTSVTDGGIGPRPKWMPGSNNIIYSHYDGTYQLLRIVDQDGRVTPFITSPPGTMTHQAEPSPSPNAPVVYFSAYDSRCSDIFYCLHRSGRDGSAPELLGTLIAPNQVTWRPSSSPDGSRVAFVTTGTVIKVFDYASKSVLGWGIAGQHPSWSPDGSRIVFVQQFGGSLRVITAADGSGQRVITPANRTYTEGSISWSADSKWVLARSNAGTLDLIEVDTGNVLPLGYTTSFQSGSLK